MKFDIRAQDNVFYGLKLKNIVKKVGILLFPVNAKIIRQNTG